MSLRDRIMAAEGIEEPLRKIEKLGDVAVGSDNVRRRLTMLDAQLASAEASIAASRMLIGDLLFEDQRASFDGECQHLGAVGAMTMGEGRGRLLCPNCGEIPVGG